MNDLKFFDARYVVDRVTKLRSDVLNEAFLVEIFDRFFIIDEC